MSMINDALKRAQESQGQNPPSGAPPLPPVESKSGGGPAWIFILVAILVIAGGVFFAMKHFSHTPLPPPPPPMTNVPALVAPPVVTNPPPTNAPVAEEPWPKVQGILFDSANPMAIVDRKTVKIGDRIRDGMQVKAIARDSVTLQQTNGLLKEIKVGK
jgi:hypothetical protein